MKLIYIRDLAGNNQEHNRGPLLHSREVVAEGVAAVGAVAGQVGGGTAVMVGRGAGIALIKFASFFGTYNCRWRIVYMRFLVLIFVETMIFFNI